MLGLASSKTQQLWWFQIVHAPNIISEFNPFWVKSYIAMLALSHQSSNRRSVGSCASEWRPACLKTWYQNCLDDTHETRRWSMFSSFWSQSGHLSGWGNPCRARWFEVHQLYVRSAIKISGIWVAPMISKFSHTELHPWRGCHILILLNIIHQ
jgi:hypothetical protein